MPSTPSARSAYSLLLAAVFACAAAIEIFSFRPADPLRFFVYLALTFIAAAIRLDFPGTPTSLAFVPILLAVVDLSGREAIFLAAAGAMVQPIRRWRQKFDPAPAIVRVLDACFAAGAAYLAFHCPWWQYALIAPIPRLAVAAAVLYLMSSGLVNSALGWFQGQPVQVHWNQGMFGLHLAGAIVAGLTHALGLWVGWQAAVVCLPMSYFLGWLCLLALERIRARKEYSEYEAELHLQTIELLALAIGARDRTHPRLRRMQFFALEIGKQLQLANEELQALAAASLLHDVGKLAIPEHILNKPGKLTPEEYEKIKIHPIVGAEILASASFPYPVAEIVSAHHERWDGTGYPNGLKGEQIPLGARILAVVECFDALTSPRPYRRALTPNASMEVIANESNHGYDPRVVSILGEQFRELEQRMKQEKSKNPETSIDDITLERLNSIANAQNEVLELSSMLHDLNYSVGLQEVLPQFAIRLKRMLPFDALVVHGVAKGKLKPQFVNGQEFEALCSLDIPLGQGVAGTSAQLKQPICNADPASEREFSSGPFPSFGSLLAVPLEGNTGVTGVMSVYRAEQSAFGAEDLRIAMAVASKLGLCLEHSTRFQQLSSSATVDFVTGLPNSRALFEHLDAEVARCQRSRETLAVVVCDLDGFKTVNDRFGHLQGNALLHLVGQQLKDSCRGYDYVARMGGDEFVILMPGLPVENLAERLAALETGIQAASRELLREEVVVGVSAGCAFFPADGFDAESLLSKADQRMYSTKSDRKSKAPETDLLTLGLVHLSRQNQSQAEVT
ncbi:MAG TPA: HD domain-containing phosphohydrolase [Bryobacteraceae bacterium]|nr:HD domain-containing phosphohydrolase [Bryobacteraceae bacterium]